ncbi:MAG TPA: methyl-accepting chemotaxis protein [Gammaproteobacteria bacterium]|nr:methyl-accepting chemotaxis protein [Gammaproteobacteria bacterium]
MFFRKSPTPIPNTIAVAPERLADLEGQLAAIDKAQAVVEFALDGTILRANANFCAVMGYSEDELKGRHHSMFVRKPDLDERYRQFWAKLGRGEYDAGQYLRLGQGGREVWIQASYNPVCHADGTPFKVVKYATDITEQVKLRETAATLSLVAHETDNSVVITDARGQIEYVNAGFTRRTGYALEEVRGRKPGEFLQGEGTRPEDRERVRAKVHAQQPFCDEILNYTKDGKPFWTLLVINPVRDAAGRLVRYVSIQTDITEMKERQIDLNTRLDAISRSTAIIEFTADGHVLFANENFCRAMGYTLDEIVGRHHRMFVTPEYAESADYGRFWAKLGSGQFDAGKYHRVARGGRDLWLQATYNPVLDHRGKVTKVIKFANDITDAQLAAMERERVVAEAAHVMASLANGSLLEVMQGQYEGDLATLKDSINSCVLNLRDMVHRIDDAARAIGSSASQIAVGNQDLSRRTESQASSLEETASSMEELAGTVAQNAQNAQRANELASAARVQAERGGSVVATAIAAMGEINCSSKKIAEIIGVIDEIAFQTNLLALNAAVEAARAGDQGRGFAVVASEVRSLAQRSAGAAKEIKSLILDSGEKVESGSRFVNETGAALEEIVASTKAVSTVIAEIAMASERQSEGIDQVNQAVTQMEQVVQQNAALVEEAAAASEAMDDQSRKLAELMRFFKLADTAEAQTAPAGPPAGVERRSAKRPWSKPATPAAPAATLDRAAGDDIEWSDF